MNNSIRNEMKSLIGDKYEPLDETDECRKLKWFGHAARHYNTLSHTVLQGMVEGVRPRGWPKTNWTNNITSWTSLTIEQCNIRAQDRCYWRGFVKVAKAPLRSWLLLREWWWWWWWSKKFEKQKMGIHTDTIVYWVFSGMCCVVRDKKWFESCVLVTGPRNVFDSRLVTSYSLQ